MGIIYDVMRQEDHDEDSITPIDSHNLIPFSDFLDLLELHTDDNLNIISLYLINEDEFLKLNFYRPYEVNTLSKDKIGYYLSPYKYDSHKDKDDITYPTENFLEDVLLENGINDYEYYYWKIEDLMSLECIVKLGLDTDSFEICKKAMYGNAHMLIEYHKKNQELFDRLKEIQSDAESNEVGNLLNDLKVANTKINEQGKYIKELENELETKKQQAKTNNDQPMHPRTANNASKIIAALTSELLKMDLTQPFASNSNGKIKAAIERQGNTVGKSVIGYWLEIAHKNSI